MGVSRYAHESLIHFLEVSIDERELKKSIVIAMLGTFDDGNSAHLIWLGDQTSCEGSQ